MDVSRVGYKESWAPKNWCFWTVVLDKTLEIPLDCREIKPVSPKGNQSWIFIGRTDAEAEAPVLWPPDVKNWLLGKGPDAGKDWRQEEKGTTEDEMFGWHHWLNGHDFEQALEVGDGQGSLVCYSPCGHEKSDTTERLNWTELPWTKVITYNAIYRLKNTYYYFALNNLRNSCHTEQEYSVGILLSIPKILQESNTTEQLNWTENIYWSIIYFYNY